MRKEDTEITLDKEDDEGSYAMIDKDEEILIEE